LKLEILRDSSRNFNSNAFDDPSLKALCPDLETVVANWQASDLIPAGIIGHGLASYCDQRIAGSDLRFTNQSAALIDD
jgi:hypothetical protein